MNLVKLLVVTFLAVTALAGCTGVQLQVVQATPAAVSSPAAQTTQAAASTTDPAPAETPTSTAAALSDAATATPTATATTTPTRTPTPTAAVEKTDEPQLTATVRPTNTPTPTVTPTREIKRLDLPGPALQLADVPEGFEEVDLVDMGLTKESLAASPFAVQSVFAFMQPETNEVILGGTVWLASVFDQFGFDVMLTSPDLVANLVIQNAGGNVKIVEKKVLPVNKVGDNSGGLTFLIDADGTLIRIDLVGFRKGGYGSFVGLAYPEKTGTALSVEEAAQTLAAKMP